MAVLADRKEGGVNYKNVVFFTSFVLFPWQYELVMSLDLWSQTSLPFFTFLSSLPYITYTVHCILLYILTWSERKIHQTSCPKCLLKEIQKIIA